jgi:hypothetical protein
MELLTSLVMKHHKVDVKILHQCRDTCQASARFSTCRMQGRMRVDNLVLPQALRHNWF